MLAITSREPRERVGSSLRTVGTSLSRRVSSSTLRPAKKAIHTISQREIPRSTKLWTEKSASTPERVRKVP